MSVCCSDRVVFVVGVIVLCSQTPLKLSLYSLTTPSLTVTLLTLPPSLTLPKLNHHSPVRLPEDRPRRGLGQLVRHEAHRDEVDAP